MRLFIIRPFGTKEGIDFERVDKELIQPAVERLAQYGFPMSGGTTGPISRQGNIREDMFRLIVASDLVIADVSIHNANAFYELGIRHALRPRHTFLIRSQTEHAYPFDLQTDRYFLYDAANPGGKVDDLVQALRSTLASVERDSPVFMLLPKLAPHGRGQLVQAPFDFFHEVCQQLGVETDLYLALPEDMFEVKSVQRGGADWVERYRALTARRIPFVLQQTEALPRWLSDRSGYDVWQRNNLWMMFNALATGSRHLTLIALFNREREADGFGGTGHLVEEARKWGFKNVELDARELLALRSCTYPRSRAFIGQLGGCASARSRARLTSARSRPWVSHSASTPPMAGYSRARAISRNGA